MLDRIEHILEQVAKNQLAMQEHHNDEFKKLMTWQVLTQDRIEKLAAKTDAQIEKLGMKIDRQAEMQAGFDARVDKLVAGIGEFIRRADARV